MSDPQEAATPSDPHSAEAEKTYPGPVGKYYSSSAEKEWHYEQLLRREGFVAGRVSRDAEVAELRAEKERWHDAALIGLAQESAARSEVAELKAKIADAWDEGLSAGCDRWADSREFGDPPINPYRSASSPVEGG